MLVAVQVGREPGAQHAALQETLLLVAAEEALRRVASGAMARSVDDIGAAVPLGALARRRLEVARLEIEPVPESHQAADRQREGQAVGRWAIGGRRLGHQIGAHGVDLGAAHAGEIGIGEGRVEVDVLVVAALVHGAVEVRLAPAADAGVAIGGDVGRIDHPEGRVQRQAAGQPLAAGPVVAALAVAEHDQVTALLDLRRRVHGHRRSLAGAGRGQDEAREAGGQGEGAEAFHGS